MSSMSAFCRCIKAMPILLVSFLAMWADNNSSLLVRFILGIESAKNS